jgi:hypothetical protein
MRSHRFEKGAANGSFFDLPQINTDMTPERRKNERKF